MISPGLLSCEHSLNTLRYADRVKELAADPQDTAKSSLNGVERPVAVESGSCSPLLEEDDDRQDDDLAQLRSMNVSFDSLVIFIVILFIILGFFFVKFFFFFSVFVWNFLLFFLIQRVFKVKICQKLEFLYW